MSKTSIRQVGTARDRSKSTSHVNQTSLEEPSFPRSLDRHIRNVDVFLSQPLQHIRYILRSDNTRRLENNPIWILLYSNACPSLVRQQVPHQTGKGPIYQGSKVTVHDHEIIPLLNSNQLVTWNRHTHFTLGICIRDRSLTRHPVRLIILRDCLRNLRQRPTLFPQLINSPSDQPYLGSNLIRDRYLLSNPAGDCPSWIVHWNDVDLVSSDADHLPSGAPHNELSSRLSMLRDKRLIQYADRAIVRLVDDQVLLLVRNHRELVEVVLVKILDSLRPHQQFVLFRDPGQARKSRVHVPGHGHDIFLCKIPVRIRFREHIHQFIRVPLAILDQQARHLMTQHV